MRKLLYVPLMLDFSDIEIDEFNEAIPSYHESLKLAYDSVKDVILQEHETERFDKMYISGHDRSSSSLDSGLIYQGPALALSKLNVPLIPVDHKATDLFSKYLPEVIDLAEPITADLSKDRNQIAFEQIESDDFIIHPGLCSIDNLIVMSSKPTPLAVDVLSNEFSKLSHDKTYFENILNSFFSGFSHADYFVARPKRISECIDKTLNLGENAVFFVTRMFTGNIAHLLLSTDISQKVFDFFEGMDFSEE